MDLLNCIACWSVAEAQTMTISCVISIPLALLLPFCAYTADGESLVSSAVKYLVLALTMLLCVSLLGTIAIQKATPLSEPVALNILSTIFAIGIDISVYSTLLFRKQLFFGILLSCIQILWLCTHCIIAQMVLRGTYF